MGRGEKARALRSVHNPRLALLACLQLSRVPHWALGRPVEEAVTLHEYIKYVPAHFYNITPGVFCHPSSDCLQKRNSQISYSRSSQKGLHGKIIEGGRLRELKKFRWVIPKMVAGHLPELFITKLKPQFKRGFTKVVVTWAGRLRECSQESFECTLTMQSNFHVRPPLVSEHLP